MPLPSRTHKECPLLTLPPEIRTQIWKLIFNSQSTIFPPVQILFNRARLRERTHASPALAERTLALARTCKLLHDEVVAAYFSQTLGFVNTYDMYRYLYMIGPERRKFVQNIEVVFAGYCATAAFELLGECMDLRKLWIAVNGQTLKGVRAQQRNLWSAWGTGTLRKIRGMKNLDLRIRELRGWTWYIQEVSALLFGTAIRDTASLEGGLSVLIKQRKICWAMMGGYGPPLFDFDHVEEFERVLGEEMSQERKVRRVKGDNGGEEGGITASGDVVTPREAGKRGKDLYSRVLRSKGKKHRVYKETTKRGPTRTRVYLRRRSKHGAKRRT